MSAAVSVAAQGLGEGELEAHIASLTRQLEWWYARYLRTGRAEYRAQAVEWMGMRDAAILARSPAAQAERHANFEQSLLAVQPGAQAGITWGASNGG